MKNIAESNTQEVKNQQDKVKKAIIPNYILD